MSWWSRLTNVFRSDRLDDDLDEEQRFHIEARANDLMGGGLAREAAVDQATRQFGPRLLLREASRDARLLTWFDAVVRDVRLGLRLLRRDAIMSAAAIVSLGLAIVACTAAFSLIDALVLRKLAARDPDQLVYVNRAGNNTDLRFTALFSYPVFERIRQSVSPHMDAFSMSHQSLRPAAMPDRGSAEEKVLTQFVSGNAFESLTDIWLPARMFQSDALQNPNQNWLQIWGRLAPNETVRTVRPIVLTALANFWSDRAANKARSQQDADMFESRSAAARGVTGCCEGFHRTIRSPLGAVGGTAAAG